MQTSDVLFTNLMSVFAQEIYEPFTYFLIENFRHENLNNVFENLKSTPFYDEILSNSKDKKNQEENILRLLNSSLHAIESIIPLFENPKFVPEKETQKILNKIKTYKKKWHNLVNDYFKKNNAKKYIIKEYLQTRPDATLDEFYKKRIKHINDWIKNSKAMLSSFYYVDDLVKSQKNLIFNSELAYILFKASIENEKLFEIDKSELEKNNSIKIKEEISAGQIPNWLLLDGLFRVSPIEVFKHENIIKNEKDKTTLIYDEENLRTNLEITVPDYFENEFLESNFDSSKDAISLGRFELAVLIGVLQIGRKQLKSSNKIAFSFNQILKLWNSGNSGKLYNRIKKALFYLSMNMYTIELPNNITRNFYIINAIEKPTFNSSGEQEWVVEIDSRLREQILEKNYTELYSEKISSLKYELSPILYKTFVIDLVEIVSNNKKPLSVITKEYTLRDLSTRTFLEGKPNIRKKKIKNSLDDILQKEDSILQDYEIKDNGNSYKMYFNKNAISTYELE